jgi:hypothetical protein
MTVKNPIATITKDPDAKLDYSLDWSDWLVTGDTIATSTWTLPTGITKYADTKSDTVATIWLTGGTEGDSYNITNHIITADGREEDRTITINVNER